MPPTTADPGGRTNPFRYAGATPLSSMTDAATSLLLLPARSYDSAQGRFTSRDTANVFNHYQAFSTNPIINTDPTGHFSLADLLIDIGVAIAFIVATVATVGAAVATLPAVAAMEAGTLTASTIAFAAATAVGAVASATGAVTSVVKMADDIDDAVNRKHFVSRSARQVLGTVETVVGVVAGVAGLGTVGATVAGAGEDIAESAVQDANDFLDSADDATAEGQPDAPRLVLAETDSQEADLSAASRSESVTPATSSPLSPEDSALKYVTGDRSLNDVDAAVFRGDWGLDGSLKSEDAAESSLWEGHSGLEDSHPRIDNSWSSGQPNPYTRLAADGDWDVDALIDRGQDLYQPMSYAWADEADLMLASDDEVTAAGGLWRNGHAGLWNSEWDE